MKPFVIVILLVCAVTFAQGPITPPAGAPVASMKTLQQIEPRAAIPPSPDSPQAGPHFTITASGSYYLTGNIEVTTGNGININASNVTLDLNGFALISKTAAPANGIAISIGSNLSAIEIKNGRISGGTERTYVGPKPWNATFVRKGWALGIQDTNGAAVQGVLLSHLTVERCGGEGIFLSGKPSVLQFITAWGNGDIGIFAPYGTVTNVSCQGNSNTGLDVPYGNVSNATVINNGQTGIRMVAGTVTNCFTEGNAQEGIDSEGGCVVNCSSAGNGGGGIIVSGGGSVSNCSTRFNEGSGIYAPGASVTNCVANSNLTAGIVVGVGVAAHCVGSNNNTGGGALDKNINVSAGGQRIGCVPAAE